MDKWAVTGTVASLAGTLLSLVGVCLSIWVLSVAKDAKHAAEEAAELVSTAARKRDLVEALESMSQKIQQIGAFVQQEEWVAARMRVEEVLSACRIVLARWPDHFSSERRAGINYAIAQVGSIGKEIANNNKAAFTEQQKKRCTDSQMRASGHIHSALGEARRSLERSGVNDGN